MTRTSDFKTMYYLAMSLVRYNTLDLEYKKLILRALNLVHQVEFKENGKAWDRVTTWTQGRHTGEFELNYGKLFGKMCLFDKVGGCVGIFCRYL